VPLDEHGATVVERFETLGDDRTVYTAPVTG